MIGRPPTFDKETSRLRRTELLRRRNKAQRIAQQELAKLYPSEYVTLKRAILKQINEQEGPVPGDEVLRTKSEQDDLRLAHIAGLLAH